MQFSPRPHCLSPGPHTFSFPTALSLPVLPLHLAGSYSSIRSQLSRHFLGEVKLSLVPKSG